jgi:hypothetical protein
VLWVRGDHDIATKVSLAASIARAAQLDEMPLLIDLSEVTFMDAPVHATGAAAALATWVDVPPIAPAGEIDHGDERSTVRRPRRPPARVPAVADVHVATVEVDRRGP